MSYCEIGVEAQVIYTLDGTKKRFTTKQTPIEVTVNQLPSTTQPGQNPNVLYSVNYITTTKSRLAGRGLFVGGISNVSGKITKAVVEDVFIPNSISSSHPEGLYENNFIVQNDKGFDYKARITPDGDYKGAYEIHSITRVDGLPDTSPQTTPRCEIRVSHSNTLLHSATGNCPIPFEVVCGEQCPEGTTKCFSTNYPGYCCLPCNEIKQGIKAITSQIRSLTNG